MKFSIHLAYLVATLFAGQVFAVPGADALEDSSHPHHKNCFSQYTGLFRPTRQLLTLCIFVGYCGDGTPCACEGFHCGGTLCTN